MDEDQLHGKVGLENKAQGVSNTSNAEGELAKMTREADALTYLQAGMVSEDTTAFKKANPEWIDMERLDDIYP